jgi:hypothetical protein
VKCQGDEKGKNDLRRRERYRWKKKKGERM